MRPTWIGGLALLALSMAGCGGQKPSLVPVRGHVFFHGAPLPGGVVVFTPDPEHGGRGPLASARIGEDGGYVLTTGDDMGAVPGWHRVTFKGGPPPTIPENGLPPRYSDPEQSGQTREVKAGQANVIDFHLE